jgi:enterochelin esterase-like enzyme
MTLTPNPDSNAQLQVAVDRVERKVDNTIETLRRVIVILDGDPNIDVVGVRNRLRKIETEQLVAIKQDIADIRSKELQQFQTFIKEFAEDYLPAIKQAANIAKNWDLLVKVFVAGILIATLTGVGNIIITILTRIGWL